MNLKNQIEPKTRKANNFEGHRGGRGNEKGLMSKEQ